MKKFLLILLAIIILLAGIILGLYLNLEPIVKASVAKYGSQLTGTKVALDGFRLSLAKGEAELKGLSITNPDGYKTPQIMRIGSVYVRLNVRSLLEPVILVNEIRITEPEITYELKNITSNNVSDLLANISKNTVSDSDKNTAEAVSSPTEPAKTSSSSADKKVIIDTLEVTGGKINLGISFDRKGASVSTPLPTVTLKDIGKEKGSQGKSIIETVSDILKKILDTAYDTAIRQGLNNLKDIAGKSADTLKGATENLKDSAKGLLGGIF